MSEQAHGSRLRIVLLQHGPNLTPKLISTSAVVPGGFPADLLPHAACCDPAVCTARNQRAEPAAPSGRCCRANAPNPSSAWRALCPHDSVATKLNIARAASLIRQDVHRAYALQVTLLHVTLPGSAGQQAGPSGRLGSAPPPLHGPNDGGWARHAGPSAFGA